MLNWIKYFTLNFFNKKYADESSTRSFWNGVLGFLIAVIVLFIALCGMTISTFPIHYNKSNSFKGFYHSLFEGENPLSLKLVDGKMYFGDDVSDDLIINTFVSDSDRALYARDNFNAIIDVRDGNATYNDFILEFVNEYEDSKNLSYEEYLELSEAKREEYSSKITLTEKSITFTSELIDSYIEYINSNGGEEDTQSLEELKKDGVIPEESYGSVYAIYYELKYSNLVSSSYQTPPTMRNYYLNTYLATDDDGNSIYDNYVIILYDVAVASWQSDEGQLVSVSGYYGNNDMVINSADSADELLIDLQNSNKLAISINLLLYMGRAIFTIIFVWLLLPMFISIIGFISKYKTLSNYSAMAKTMGGFWFGSMIPSVLFVIIASFFLSQTYVFYISIGILLAACIIRTIIHYIPLINEERKDKKIEKEIALMDGENKPENQDNE